MTSPDAAEVDVSSLKEFFSVLLRVVESRVKRRVDVNHLMRHPDTAASKMEICSVVMQEILGWINPDTTFHH